MTPMTPESKILTNGVLKMHSFEKDYLRKLLENISADDIKEFLELIAAELKKQGYKIKFTSSKT